LASQASIEIKELSQDSLILPLRSIAATIRDAVLAECSRAGFRPKLQQEIATIQTALGLVAMGLGVSVLPASIRYLSREGVVILPIRNSPIEVPLRLLWKRGYVSPVVQNLLETIEAPVSS
jgi:DNA-binding transcriptional LysR family regulator